MYLNYKKALIYVIIVRICIDIFVLYHTNIVSITLFTALFNLNFYFYQNCSKINTASTYYTLVTFRTFHNCGYDIPNTLKYSLFGYVLLHRTGIICF